MKTKLPLRLDCYYSDNQRFLQTKTGKHPTKANNQRQ